MRAGSHRRRAGRGSGLPGADRLAAGTPRAFVPGGFMGAGKTTAARAVAEALGVEAVDADELLEARLGMPIARFFDERGEAAFRAEEAAAVRGLRAREAPGVVALGGGSVPSRAVREALDAHRVLWLDVGVE